MQQPHPEILYNPISLQTLSTRKISDSLAAHCGRGASFGELCDSVAHLPLPGPVRQALMREDENIVCAESVDRLDGFLGMLEGIRGITRAYIRTRDEETVCVHGRKNRVRIIVYGDRNEREFVFAEAAEAEEFWREFKWILCNAGHIVASLAFRIDRWLQNSYSWFPPTFFGELLKKALETETPTNFIARIIVDIPPNAGVTDPILQLIADQAQHIQLTRTDEEGVGYEFRWYQLRKKKNVKQTFNLYLEIKNGQIRQFYMYTFEPPFPIVC